MQARGVYAVEEYLQARYYMFRQVYFHRTLRSAEAVLRSIIRRALQLLDDGEEVWHAEGTAFEKILRREVLSISEHMQVDDSDFVFHIKQWQNSSDAILSDLSRRFISRRLFKAVDLDMPRDQQAEFLVAARKAVEHAGFDPEYYFIEDRASDVPYYSYYEAEKAEPKTHIYVESGYASPQYTRDQRGKRCGERAATCIRTSSSLFPGGSKSRCVPSSIIAAVMKRRRGQATLPELFFL